MTTPAERDACYNAGCCCLDVHVSSHAACHSQTEAQRRPNYYCGPMNTPIILPRTELIALTVFDFDGTANYREEFVFTEYEYYKTPLRPSSEAARPVVDPG